jgi:hypothetical protein
MRGVKPNQPCEAELVDDFPEVPDHPPITRRDQFAVKNSLKKDKQDKQEARTKAKATAKPKPRGRPKKQHVEVEDATVESVDLRKQKKADKNKAARKRRQKNKRQNKARRVRAAQKLQETNAGDNQDGNEKANKTDKHSKPSTGKAAGKKSQAVKNQPSAGSTAKNKKPKETGRKRKTKITAEPDEKLKNNMITILRECQHKGCSCDDHSQEVWDLMHCNVPGYSFSVYWTRSAAGLKTLVKNLPKELQNPKAKKPDQQFAYFADGPCAFVNLFKMTYLVIP